MPSASVTVSNGSSCVEGSSAAQALSSGSSNRLKMADLGPMAYAVLLAVTRQLEREGRLEPAGTPPFLSPSGPV